MKKEYKQLQKRLKDEFKIDINNFQYKVIGSIRNWVEQCDIKCNDNHIRIICTIFNNSAPYPYQQVHRYKILYYLATHKYKQFKKLLSKH